MARRAKKRYARATVNGEEHVFEFDVEELDNKHLIAMALAIRPSEVKKVSWNSVSTAKPSWYIGAKTRKHQYQVDYEVKK